MQVRIFIIFLFLCSNVNANTNYSFKCIASDFQCIESNGFEKFKIGDDESLEYLYLFKDNFLILLIKMNANKGLMESSTEYIFLEYAGKMIKPFYISSDINNEIIKTKKSGIIVYKLDDMISPQNWKNDKYFLNLKNKDDKSKKININIELLNSKFTFYDGFNLNSFKKHLLEAKMILTISDLEKPNQKEIIINDSINKLLEEIGNYPELTESYQFVYLKSFAEENINNSISLFDSSFLKGNENGNFMKNYFIKSVEYTDTLFKNKNYEELKVRTDTSLDRFKDLSQFNKTDKDKLDFYNTYSFYYLMNTDQEIKGNAKNLKDKFSNYILIFKNTNNKDLECYSRLAIGNIQYVLGNYFDAETEYKILVDDVNTPDEIKEKALNNLEIIKKD